MYCCNALNNNNVNFIYDEIRLIYTISLCRSCLRNGRTLLLQSFYVQKCQKIHIVCVNRMQCEEVKDTQYYIEAYCLLFIEAA